METMPSAAATAAFSILNPGWKELCIVFGLILILFGPKRFPAVIRSILHAIQAFRKEADDLRRGIESAGEERKARPPRTIDVRPQPDSREKNGRKGAEGEAKRSPPRNARDG